MLGCEGLQECLLLVRPPNGEGRVQLQLPRKKKGDIHIPLAVHTLSSKDCREEFQQSLCQLLLQHPHCVDDQHEDNWGRLKRCIVE